MFLFIKSNSRIVSRSKTNRLKAKKKAKNRRRVNGMRRRALGRRLGKA